MGSDSDPTAWESEPPPPPSVAPRPSRVCLDRVDLTRKRKERGGGESTID